MDVASDSTASVKEELFPQNEVSVAHSTTTIFCPLVRAGAVAVVVDDFGIDVLPHAAIPIDDTRMAPAMMNFLTVLSPVLW
jgi:hypothetical protein